MSLQTFIDFLEVRQHFLISSLEKGAIPIQSEICLNGLILSTYSLEYQHECDDVHVSPQKESIPHSFPGWSFVKCRLR